MDIWPSAPVQEATLDLLSLILLWKYKKTTLMDCFETYWTTVSSGRLDDTIQAAWMHATFSKLLLFLMIIIFNAGGSLDMIL